MCKKDEGSERCWSVALAIMHIRGFHEVDEIGNVDIRGFTAWKQKVQLQNITSSEDWTEDLCVSCLMLFFLS